MQVQHGYTTGRSLFSLVVFFICSAEFIIKNDAGAVCKYSQELGFGSSYTLIIPSTFTFGDKVTCKATLSHASWIFLIELTSAYFSVYYSAQKASCQWWTWSLTLSTWPGRFLNISSWLQERWSSLSQALSSPTHRCSPYLLPFDNKVCPSWIPEDLWCYFCVFYFDVYNTPGTQQHEGCAAGWLAVNSCCR